MKEEKNMELGKKIRQLRFKAGFTQEQLAAQLGISAQSVSKWENNVAMPDITALPLLAEIFGIRIDDLFDLSVQQRLNRIENRMDIEEELPQDVFREYEEFLKAELSTGENRKRVTELLSYLYWHRMHTYADKVSRYAKDAIRQNPGEKGCYWELTEAERHAVWDWNMANHTKAIDFYKELAEANPDTTLPCMYLIDNLIADHRADEAETWLDRYSAMEKANPVMKTVYRAYIALARFDEPAAEKIMNDLLAENPDDSTVLFEAAQYYASKCDYQKAVGCYELSFEKDPKKPRFMDALMGISDIYQIMGNYAKAAETYERITDLLKNEWGFTEETELQSAIREKARLKEKAEQQKES